MSWAQTMDPQAPNLTSVWIAYYLGFSLTLGLKWLRAVKYGAEDGKTPGQVTLEWFFEPSTENGVSWIATIGGVWVLGSIYIDGIINIAGFSDLPVRASIAFFLGSLFEMLVPNLMKWFASKIYGG